MSKRRRQSTSSPELSGLGDDAWNGSAEHVPNSDHESEESDASYVQKPRRTKSRVNNVNKKAKHSSDGDFNPVAHQSKNSPSAGDSQHPRSIHVIRFPGPIRTALLQWYANVHDTRGMPWRKPYDPSQGLEERSQRAYEVWVSEIMLQQTQVSTVIPYYNRWIEKFPTVHDLANATIDEVNTLWKGLGYYSRASRLLAGAQKVVQQYGGRLPDNAKDMEANIPGIGRYSAGAICSIAYGERVPVLDGNVHRLLSRFLAIHALPKAKATLDLLWAAASAMVQEEGDDGDSSPCSAIESDISSLPKNKTTSPQYAGDINQALIELGSTVCKVRDPDCGSCPLRTWCAAFQAVSERDKQDALDIEDVCNFCEPLADRTVVMSYPMKVQRKKAREELDVVNVVEWRNSGIIPNQRQFLLIKRPESGLLAGLYEFPTLANVSSNTTQTSLPKIAYDILSSIIQTPFPPFQQGSTRRSRREDPSDFQPHIIKIAPVGDVIHVFSHVRKTYRVQWVVIQGGSSPPPLKLEFDGIEETKSKKGKRGLRGLKGEIKIPLLDGSWVPLEEVADANMGTGLFKVWNLAKGLWEKDSI